MVPGCCWVFASRVMIPGGVPDKIDGVLFLLGAWMVVAFVVVFDCMITDDFGFDVDDRVAGPARIVCALLFAFEGG